MEIQPPPKPHMLVTQAINNLWLDRVRRVDTHPSPCFKQKFLQKGLGLESTSELDDLVIPGFRFSLHFSDPFKKHLLSTNSKDIPLEKFE